ncbi:PSP1 domain-containing protein [Blattabacterium cuenoti]|uniref:PSP1 domain-containing protein n=1 Tax=Blattabacterium cuenoti TaxID=1653831 RepID=UPI00163C055E|nr:regulatory iron-sulfur-containing complex subunit RicT [Blattabacterium cuenoti]
MKKSCTVCSQQKCNQNIEGKCVKLNVVDWLSNIRSPFIDEKEYYIVEVQFKNDRKEFFHNEKKINLFKDDFVTVESKLNEYDIGKVTLTGELVKIQMRNKNISLNSLKMKKIYRKSTKKEISKYNFLKKEESSMLLESRKIANELNISMKICDIEYQGDGEKATFYYTAENRIDFRQLIKNFASKFRIRIEMRQIGYRQESAKIGGIGSCGRELCCSTWLKNFRSVSTNSARYQQLSINIEKLTGLCNKLKCCLNYELDTYLSSIKDFPDFNCKIKTKKGIAQCMKIDVFQKKMWFSYIKKPNIWFSLNIDDIKIILKKDKITPPLEELTTVNIIKRTELTFH